MKSSQTVMSGMLFPTKRHIFSPNLSLPSSLSTTASHPATCQLSLIEQPTGVVIRTAFVRLKNALAAKRVLLVYQMDVLLNQNSDYKPHSTSQPRLHNDICHDSHLERYLSACSSSCSFARCTSLDRSRRTNLKRTAGNVHSRPPSNSTSAKHHNESVVYCNNYKTTTGKNGSTFDPSVSVLGHDSQDRNVKSRQRSP